MEPGPQSAPRRSDGWHLGVTQADIEFFDDGTICRLNGFEQRYLPLLSSLS